MKLSVDEFGKLVDAAMAEIPPPLQRYLENVIVEVEATPSGEDLAEVDIDDPTELLGLYHGTPLTERGLEFAGALPDRITIYQRNIERFCRSRREIVEEIRTTVLHEIGHHFGLDEDDLFDVGYE
jgi:predicted Zn-dependent protease with MMP-like domain